MAKRVQRRRGTTGEHSSFTGAVGEITVDLTKDTAVIHDGTTAGGFPLARENMSNVTNSVGIAQLAFSDGSNGQFLKTNGSGTLSFATVDATSATIGGDLSGTVGNAQIKANVVTPNEIAANAVTTVKILDANVTTAKLADANITTVKIADNAITTAKIAASQVNSSHILDESIIASDLASDSVTAIKILDGNISTAKIADAAITAVKILDGAVSTNKISSGAVTSTQLSNGAVATVNIAADAIDGTKIADNAINSEHYTDGSVDMIHVEASAKESFQAYDVAFNGGFDKDMNKEDVAVAVYGEMVMCRAGTLLGESGYIDTAPTGSPCIVEIEKNGSSIYSTKPQFGASSNTLTAGVLAGATTSFSPADRITFKITQKGSSAAGQGCRFTLKCKV